MAIKIRELRAKDLRAIAARRGGAAWRGDSSRWQAYLAQHEKGSRVVLLAETAKGIIGYASLKWISGYRHFRKASIPEIQDLVVAEDQRRSGVGTRLIRALEKRARAAGHTQVGIGVGLYRDYGAAQRLYVRLGYVPDGQGVCHKNFTVQPWTKARVDDDLVLRLVRSL